MSLEEVGSITFLSSLMSAFARDTAYADTFNRCTHIDFASKITSSSMDDVVRIARTLKSANYWPTRLLVKDGEISFLYDGEIDPEAAHFRLSTNNNSHFLYHLDLMDKSLPQQKEISLRKLLEAIELIHWIASLLHREYIMTRSRPRHDSDFRDLAGCIPVHRLVHVLKRSLRLTASGARHLVSMLSVSTTDGTLRFGRDGVWSKPLYPLNDGRVLLCLPAALSPNPLFLLQLWLFENSVNFQARGNQFERSARLTIQQTLERNPLIDEFFVVERNEKLFDSKGQQDGDLDLIFRIGANVFAGEAKAFNLSFDAADDFKQMLQLQHSCGKLNSLIDKYLSDRVRLAKLVRFDGCPSNLKIAPFCVTNHCVAFSVVCSVPIIACDLLFQYLAQSSYCLIGLQHDETCEVEIKLYKDAGDCGKNLPRYLSGSPSRMMYDYFMKYYSSYFPDPCNATFPYFGEFRVDIPNSFTRVKDAAEYASSMWRRASTGGAG